MGYVTSDEMRRILKDTENELARALDAARNDRDAAIRRAETSEAERVEIREQLEDLRREYNDAAVAAGRVLGEIGADVDTSLVKNIGALAQALQKSKRKRVAAEGDAAEFKNDRDDAREELNRARNRELTMARERDTFIGRSAQLARELEEMRSGLANTFDTISRASAEVRQELEIICADPSLDLVSGIVKICNARAEAASARLLADDRCTEWRKRALAAEKETTRIGQASVMMKNVGAMCGVGDVMCVVAEKQWRVLTEERDEWKRRGVAAETEEGKMRSELSRARERLLVATGGTVHAEKERDEWRKQIGGALGVSENAELSPCAAATLIHAEKHDRKSAIKERDLIKTELDTTRSALSIALAAGNAMLRNDKSRKLADPIAQAKAEVELLSNVAEWHEKEAARLKTDAGRFLSMIDDAARG